MIELISLIIISAGVCFFVAGTVGLIRFPDAYSRLHAVTKADTLGLGLVIFGLILQSDSIRSAILMLGIWVLMMASAATACPLLARYQKSSDEEIPRAD
ncbi:cation:proton antiporter [Methylophaga nitratireducenticrescens]|uniref:Multisubunit Na+/H+ antiporter, MnhG subunit n=2 Tax=Methylophaga nitratireducenticrescens TaxID=754476 RepID=I1XHP7_METNJ|nr:cation:proton antiporter [Methylophaga nitratireducenticrescens]